MNCETVYRTAEAAALKRTLTAAELLSKSEKFADGIRLLALHSSAPSTLCSCNSNLLINFDFHIDCMDWLCHRVVYHFTVVVQESRMCGINIMKLYLAVQTLYVLCIID